jgi:CheY-like chemotaxis protein
LRYLATKVKNNYSYEMIAIVDDSEDVTAVFEYISNSLNVSALTFNSGKIGLDQISSLNVFPKVIFVDFYLQDMTGADFIYTLRKHCGEKLTGTKLVILTNLPLFAPQLKEITPKIDGVEQKPKSIEEGQTLILKWLSSNANAPI